MLVRAIRSIMTPASMAAAAMTQTEPDFVLRPSKRLQQDAEMERLAREDWSYFRLIVAPAAGPRNFVSMGLDPQLSASWHNPKAHEQLQEGKRRRAWPETWLLGGSMAALRWAALCSGGGATDALQSAFCKMMYKHGDTGETLGAYMQELLGIAAPDPGKVVHHPSMRLALMVSELKPWCAAISKLHLQSLFYMLLAANVVTPTAPKLLTRRLCFYTGPAPPSFFDADSQVLCLPLTESNLYQVLMATTALPFISPDCTYIAGLGHGLYCDAALTDYNLNCVIRDAAWPTLLLSMSCDGGPILANIWDTYVPWRKLPASAWEHVSVLSPTSHYAARLPSSQLPNTWDFFAAQYIKQPHLRMKAWDAAYELSKLGLASPPAHLLPHPWGQAALRPPAHPAHPSPRPATSRLPDELPGTSGTLQGTLQGAGPAGLDSKGAAELCL